MNEHIYNEIRMSNIVFDCCWVFRSTREFFTHGDVTMTGEGFQVLTYARHLFALSSEGSSACHTYCETGHPFIMVISENPWHLHLLPSVLQWNCTYLIYDLGLSRQGFEHPTICLRGDALTHWATAAGIEYRKKHNENVWLDREFEH